MTAASRFPGVTLKYCFEPIGFTQLPYKLEFARRAGKFQFSGFLSQTEMHIFRCEKGSPPAALSVYFSLTAVP